MKQLFLHRNNERLYIVQEKVPPEFMERYADDPVYIHAILSDGNAADVIHPSNEKVYTENMQPCRRIFLGDG